MRTQISIWGGRNFSEAVYISLVGENGELQSYVPCFLGVFFVGVGGLERFRGNGGRVQERGRSLGCDEGFGCLEARFVIEDWTVNKVKVALGLI